MHLIKHQIINDDLRTIGYICKLKSVRITYHSDNYVYIYKKGIKDSY